MYKVSGGNRRDGNYKGPRVTHKEPQGQAKEESNSPSTLMNDVHGDRVEMWDEKKEEVIRNGFQSAEYLSPGTGKEGEIGKGRGRGGWVGEGESSREAGEGEAEVRRLAEGDRQGTWST